MRSLVTPEEMAAAERRAVDSGTPVEVLMERAGRAVARTAIRMLGGRYGKKVVVVSGKGNNGGDGYAAARVLKREGVGVRCMTVADPSEVKEEAGHQRELCLQDGVRITPFDGSDLDCDLIIDAIYGTGLESRPGGIPDDYFRVIQALGNERGEALILSVDTPSGINGGSGPIMSPVHADVTVTFDAEKVGNFLAPSEYTGLVEIADIGIRCSGEIEVLERPDVVELMPSRQIDSHKRS
ncbi:MAG: NAD(P)H-hydrate epimerase, partial [Actinobacteria bacterium]|nr:NAD(P)H-hydrate epimerase [Actinomycetota bacterium]